MGKIRRFLGFLAFLFVCTFGANSFADGYTCDSDEKQYTACNANYYMSGGSGPGNACLQCPGHSYTSSNNTSTACTCDTGYSATGSQSGDTTTTSTACSPISDYSITYVMNSGTNYSGAPNTYTYGTGATINGIPTRANYVFTGCAMWPKKKEKKGPLW